MGYWLINTAGIGSIIVFVVGLSAFAAYAYMLRWIQTAPRDPAPTETPAEGEEIPSPGAGGEDA
jgi:hypothetical protein